MLIVFICINTLLLVVAIVAGSTIDTDYYRSRYSNAVWTMLLLLFVSQTIVTFSLYIWWRAFMIILLIYTIMNLSISFGQSINRRNRLIDL
jgi:hypothetical protein